MNNYWRALRARKQALAECEHARRGLHDSIGGVIGVYQAHPMPTLAGAAGIGFVLAQLRIGSGLMRTGVRIATGPVWQLVHRYFHILT